MPETPEDLRRFSLIGPDRNSGEIEFLRERGFDCSAENTAIRTDDQLAQWAALRAGLGIGVCSRQLAQRHGLVRVLPEFLDFAVDVWIAMHQDMRRVQRVSAVFDGLGAGLQALLEG
ncbi:LysR substrate-binding domain-containing protein [Pseudomonas kribbensis]|uniref:LysR substrate-binding domain-containing protein n=1 Tax=Pseudomonas kribbensis TaxID=1628086 RepID=UPI001FC9C768|nr:LysR substrate-binding domain-containing protein [Pseudomonas kribbensis]